MSRMSDADIVKNFKIIQDQINELNKKVSATAETNKAMLEDGMIELASIITDNTKGEE